MELHERVRPLAVDKKFGSPGTAIDARGHFVKKLKYKKVEPVQVTLRSPGKRNKVVCYGLLYNRPEFRNEDWLYLLIEKSDLESVYSRKHYYSLNGNDWYIAGYTDERSMQEQYADFHPFGHIVQLTQWNSGFPLDTDRWGYPADEGTYPRLELELVSLYTGEVVTA